MSFVKKLEDLSRSQGEPLPVYKVLSARRVEVGWKGVWHNISNNGGQEIKEFAARIILLQELTPPIPRDPSKGYQGKMLPGREY